FLDLIEYLGGWMADAPVVVVCVARPELLEKRPGWATTPGAAITLAALSAEESEALLANLDDEIVGERRSLIAEIAEGNPLYLEQLLAYVAENGGGERDLPTTIEALIAARLDELPHDARVALERAAVVGREF